MNKKEIAKAKMIVAMEYIARQVNDEDILDGWLQDGVADGEIPRGSLDVAEVDNYWLEDNNFKDLMTEFLKMMAAAWNDGGLYCAGVVSDDKSNEDEDEPAQK